MREDAVGSVLRVLVELLVDAEDDVAKGRDEVGEYGHGYNVGFRDAIKDVLLDLVTCAFGKKTR